MSRNKKVKKASQLSRRAQPIKAPAGPKDVNYVKYLRRYSELASRCKCYCKHKIAFKNQYGPAGEVLWNDFISGRAGRVPLSIAKAVYVRPEYQKTLSDLPPPRRDQDMFGYSFEAQVAGAPPPPFSFQAICDLVGEGLEYHVSMYLAWRDYPIFFSMDLADALENMEPKWWPEGIWLYKPVPSGKPLLNECAIWHEAVRMLKAAHIGLIHWIEMSESVERLKSLGMPENGLSEDSSLEFKEEYLTLCRILQAQVKEAREWLNHAWAQGKGGRWADLSNAEPNGENSINNIQIRFSKPAQNVTHDDWAQGIIFDFCQFNMEEMLSFIPAAQTQLFLEYAMKEDKKLPYKWSRHLLHHLNTLITTTNLYRAVRRADWCDKSHDISIKQCTRSLWPKSFITRYDLWHRMLDFITIGQTPPSWVLLYFDGNGKAHFAPSGGQFRSVVQALDAEFGPIDKVLIPGHILERKPLWMPGRAFKIRKAVPPSDTTAYVQSGHAYRKEKGLDDKGDKAQVESTSHLDADIVEGLKGLALTTTETSDIESTDAGLKAIFRVNTRLYTIAKQLTDPTKKQQQLMEHIGFRVEGTGGSMHRFTPPDNAGRFFVEHAPHPEPSLDRIRYRALGKRLQRLYGWDLDWFATSAQD